MDVDHATEDLLRLLAPQVLGTLVRRYGMFDACEDATQEALLKAAQRWPAEGVPDNPRGWLVTVASHRLLDELRADVSRRRREVAQFGGTPQAELLAPPADADPDTDRDDSLRLLFLCCHPALSAPSQIALTLRAVGGLTTAQIAAAFLVPESTMAQRISRAKQTIKVSGLPFAMPDPADRADRLRAVLHVLYLVFNEGYTASSGADLTVLALSTEALRLTRWLHRLLPERLLPDRVLPDGPPPGGLLPGGLLPGDGEVAGLLALMLLTEARRPARTRPDGSLAALDEQDRSKWDRGLVDEGVALLTATLGRGPTGPYQLQAAIAAVHDEADSVAATDWPQVLALYELLEQTGPNPMVTLNKAVAVAMVAGPEAGLRLVAELESEPRLASHHRLLATRAHLRELAGDTSGAVADYRAAARRTASLPERRHLTLRAARLAPP